MGVHSSTLDFCPRPLFSVLVRCIFVNNPENFRFFVNFFPEKFGWCLGCSYLCIRFQGQPPVANEEERSLKGFHEDREVVQEASPVPSPIGSFGMGEGRETSRSIFLKVLLNLDITDSS